jgi:hypothetical protein
LQQNHYSMKFKQLFTVPVLVLLLSVNFISCKDDDKNDDPKPVVIETCSDGIQNQNETGIDCGGICTPCPTCSDGIQNQDETGIDCGGVCPNTCSTGAGIMTAKVDGVNWAAGTPLSVTNTPATKITAIGINSSAGTRITIIYNGTFATGTVALGPTFSLEYRDAAGTVYSGITGTITFTQFNTTTHQFSGTFSGQVKNTVANITKSITVGVLTNVSY